MTYPRFEIMQSGRKQWPIMVREKACAVAYFKHARDAQKFCIDADRDPISGRKREVEWPISATRNGPVDATGRAVVVSEFGDWVYK